MALKPGTQLGPYRITEPIGAGGMGEVYRATDTNLERDVAIKVLPDDVAHDSERLARFEREARILASVNHPNIAHIYGLEEADGVKALILELVEGPTLADRIAQGPLSLEEALPVARQVCAALEAAHGQGIIHRDLKPANVKVKPDGTVKVLDFGLAKAVLPEATDSDPSASPTLTAATQLGAILGTAAYMSPEQARGKPVDKRADIWAFGVVLFEMLSGRRPFAGNDVSGTLAKVIEREPDWAALPTDLPPTLETFLRRCLAKEPGQRIHDIADMRLAIEGAFDMTHPGRSMSATRPHAWQHPAMIALMVLVATVVTAVVSRYARPGHVDQESIRFTIPEPKGARFSTSVETHNLALSPDGRRLAFVAETDEVARLWLRSLGDDTAELLADTEHAFGPFWSPDGEWVAFFTRQQLFKLRPGAGPPVIICRAEGAKTGSWGPHDTIVFTQRFSERDGIYRVTADGGEPRLLVERDPEGQVGQRWPVFLPDGERFLYSSFNAKDQVEGMSLHVGELSSASSRHLFPLESQVRVATGHLVYVEKGHLLARPFDFDRLRFSGDAVLLGTDLPQFVTAWAPFTVSESAIAYGTRFDVVQLGWWDRRGRKTDAVIEPGPYRSAALSVDGSKLAVEVQDGADRDIWVHDLERGGRTRFTSEAGMDSQPIWSPDGTRIVYTRHGPGARNGLYLRELKGGEATPLDDSLRGLLWANDWSRDGAWIVYEQGSSDTGNDLWLFSMNESGPPIPRLQTRFNEEEGRFSPDGYWLAYSSNESGRYEVYVAAVSGSDRGIRLSTDGGSAPRWGDDGEEIYYRSPNGIAVASIAYREDGIVPGRPTELFQAEAGLVAVSADGERFLMGESAEPYTVHMILNWKDELRESK